jgi:hypothetical protein
MDQLQTAPRRSQRFISCYLIETERNLVNPQTVPTNRRFILKLEYELCATTLQQRPGVCSLERSGT